MKDTPWNCIRCKKTFDVSDYFEERGFIVCPTCRLNRSVKLGEYRWALILCRWHCRGRNKKTKLLSFWPQDNDGKNLKMDTIVDIALGIHLE
ncbi:MAG: hypothetical protein ABFQ53_03790 [Patescibacteria group bacterium]